MKTEHVAFCKDDRCDYLARTAADDIGKFKSAASHHAWAHGHVVVIFRSDLEPIATYDPTGISAQVPLF